MLNSLHMKEGFDLSGDAKEERQPSFNGNITIIESFG